jgi:hypothetical protein
MADTKMYDANGELTNHALLVKVMLTDLLANYEDNRDEMTDLDRQVRERFGEDAMENSASYFTGWHYSSEDILNTAIFSPEWLERLMRNGSHDRDCCASINLDPHREGCAECDCDAHTAERAISKLLGPDGHFCEGCEGSSGKAPSTTMGFCPDCAAAGRANGYGEQVGDDL